MTAMRMTDRDYTDDDYEADMADADSREERLLRSYAAWLRGPEGTPLPSDQWGDDAPPCEYIRSTGEGTHYCALAAAPQGEPAYSYACRLAESMYRRHYQEDISPAWTPLPDLLGVLTQIDNMVSGLVRREAARTALEALIYHREQTRPIDRTDAAIVALREALK